MFDHQSVLNHIFKEVILNENSKKNLSREILMEKDQTVKDVLIYHFLSCELDKHEMFQGAALIALNYSEQDILNKLEEFYRFSEGGDLSERIEEEIQLSSQLLQIAKKGTKKNVRLNFVERRYLQEVDRYVIAQARFYVSIK